MNLLTECAQGAGTTELQVLKCAALSYRGNSKGFTDPDAVADRWYGHYLRCGITSLPPFVHEYLNRTIQVIRAAQNPVAA